MLRPLAKAAAALLVPILRPFVDALAEEWVDGQEDEEAEFILHRAHPVGFSAPDRPSLADDE